MRAKKAVFISPAAMKIQSSILPRAGTGSLRRSQMAVRKSSQPILQHKTVTLSVAWDVNS
jgi:hypothetical protein